MLGHVKAWQGSSAALVIPTRIAVVKLYAFHSANEDNVSYFYDLNRAPVEGDPSYLWTLYGKGTFELTMPGDGVLFENGLYVTPAANSVLTIFYTGV